MAAHGQEDTGIGGGGRCFPATRGSALDAARSDDPDRRRAAHDALARAYWKPCYAWLRSRWRLSNEDAQELVQSFFVRALEHDLVARYDADRGAFRHFLRGALDNHARAQRESDGRQKRGGGARALDAGDVAEPADPAPAPDAELDARFRREWQRSVLESAIEALRAHCAAEGRGEALACFERYDLHDDARGERPTYAAIARELSTSETQVTNHLHWARGRLRELVLAELRAASGSDAGWREDARDLLGPDAG